MEKFQKTMKSLPLKKIIERLDFSRLIKSKKSRGRKGYNPVMIFSLIAYGEIKGVRSSRDLAEKCIRDTVFMWISQGETPGKDVFQNFKKNTPLDILKDLHYQKIKIFEKEGHLKLKDIYIDGTKIDIRLYGEEQ